MFDNTAIIEKSVQMKVILQREIKNMFNDICEYIAELSNLHICLYPYSPQTSEKIIYDVKKEYGLNITTVFAHCDEQYSNDTIVSSNVKPFSELLDITNKSEYLIILGDKINWQLDFWCLEWNGFPCDKLLNFEQLSFYKTVIDNVATTCEEDYQEIFNNIDKCKEVYDLLDDEKSKKIYLRMLAKKITSCPFYFDVFTENQYYNEKLVGKLSDEIFFDVGAYDGDTVINFAKRCKDYRHIYAFEPDRLNFQKLHSQTDSFDNITCLNAGLSDQSGEIVLRIADYGSSHLFGNFSWDSTNDDCCSALAVSGDSLNLSPTFIKMDIEGSEVKAITGLKNTIARCKPKLAICVYHHLSDLWLIPLLIHSYNRNYKLKIAHHSYGVTETVLYAI